MKAKNILFAIFACLLFTACQKSYPDGPEISLRSPEKRLIKTWILQELYVNGNNSDPGRLNIIEIRSDKTFKYISPGSSVWSGTWELDSDKNKLSFAGTSYSLSYNDTIGTSRGTSYSIRRLKNKSLWLLETNNSPGPLSGWKTIEYHYVPAD